MSRLGKAIWSGVPGIAGGALGGAIGSVKDKAHEQQTGEATNKGRNRGMLIGGLAGGAIGYRRGATYGKRLRKKVQGEAKHINHAMNVEDNNIRKHIRNKLSAPGAAPKDKIPYISRTAANNTRLQAPANRFSTKADTELNYDSFPLPFGKSLSNKRRLRSLKQETMDGRQFTHARNVKDYRRSTGLMPKSQKEIDQKRLNVESLLGDTIGYK